MTAAALWFGVACLSFATVVGGIGFAAWLARGGMK